MVEANGGTDGDRDDGAAITVDDIGGGNMICSKHPFKNNHNNPGGICAFCLQDKLGKLVSSSLPIAVFPSSTSSAAYSFRSESGHGGISVSAATRSFGHSLSTNHGHGNTGFVSSSSSQYKEYHQRKPRIPFLSYRKKKDASTTSPNGSVIFKRSKSTATPSRRFLDGDEDGGDVDSPQKRRFWSFLQSKHRSGKRSSANSNGGLSSSSRTTPALTATPSASFSQRARGKDAGGSSVRRRIEGDIAEEEDDSPGSHVTPSTSFGRKVSRSRSVGCGSRSFSGDFFERLSTGLGDCTLRRVESQREGNKSKVAAVRGGDQHSCVKERVRCGGIFGGFIMTSSLSSSSSSSQWVPSTAGAHGKTNAMSTAALNGQVVLGRGRSWAWAFASPMRAFSKPTSGKDSARNKSAAPNLGAIPSLLSVSS
uniref:Uncharacterized protein n=1 Tax=Kalanchoe fedtschenkoi TaxID=63787 RepID=A0A7N0UQ22_KALFE